MSISESELITHLKKLPPLPAPLQEVLRFLNDPQSNWAKIGKVMLKDPVLTGRVLQIANSSFYGLHRQVKDIEIACSVLGAETLRGLVYTLILLSKFRHGQDDRLKDYNLLWRNSLAVDCLVKKIERQTRQDPTTAFTIGLFHSLDLIIQDYFFRDVLITRFEKYRTENSLPNDEKIHYLIDTEYWWLSAVLLEHWQFPESIVSVFRSSPDTSVPKMKVVVLASNMILRNLDAAEKIPDDILVQVTTLFKESELSDVDFQECVYDSQALCREMASWMFS